MRITLVYLQLAVVTLLCSGCFTIRHFYGDPESQSTLSNRYSQWHHDGVLGLVEFSDAETPLIDCPKGLKVITIRRSPGQIFLSLIPYIQYFWTPWEVAYECASGPKRASAS